MFIELIDGLRCPAEHRPISLVACITQRDERYVAEGVLGCPTCRSEYPIHDGVAWFDPPPDAGSVPSGMRPDDEDGLMRIGALLNAAEGSTVALVGDWTRNACALAAMVRLRVFAVNPAAAVLESPNVGLLYSRRQLPFRSYSLRGVAVGEPGWSLEELERATRTIAYGGRMVAPVSTPVPSDIEEIARDENVWVGEKRAALVALRGR